MLLLPIDLVEQISLFSICPVQTPLSASVIIIFNTYITVIGHLLVAPINRAL